MQSTILYANKYTSNNLFYKNVNLFLNQKYQD